MSKFVGVEPLGSLNVIEFSTFFHGRKRPTPNSRSALAS